MSLRTVVYTTEDGFKEIRRVPENASYMDYGYGALVGPPDLSGLNLGKRKTKELNNTLVDAQLVNLESLDGKRAILSRLLEPIVGKNKVTYFRNLIVYLYQREAHPGSFPEGDSE